MASHNNTIPPEAHETIEANTSMIPGSSHAADAPLSGQSATTGVSVSAPYGKSLLSDAEQTMSERISILRVLLLLFVVLHHAEITQWDFPPETPGNWLFSLTPWFGFSIPVISCFFVVSGYLLTWKLAPEEPLRYGLLLPKKIRTLLVPYLCWNSLILLPHLLLPLLTRNKSILPQTEYSGKPLLEILGNAYGITRIEPVDVPLWFLRNEFLYMCAAPILLWLLRRALRAPLLLLATIFLITVMTDGWGFGFFLFGMCWGLMKFDVRRLDRIWPILAFLLLCGIAAFPYLVPIPGMYQLYHLVFVGILFPLVGWIWKRPGIRRLLLWLAPMSFFLYCAHSPIVTVLRRVFLKLGRGSSSPDFLLIAFPLIFLGVCAICFSAYVVMQRIAPGFLSMLCGGRVKKSS